MNKHRQIKCIISLELILILLCNLYLLFSIYPDWCVKCNCTCLCFIAFIKHTYTNSLYNLPGVGFNTVCVCVAKLELGLWHNVTFSYLKISNTIFKTETVVHNMIAKVTASLCIIQIRASIYVQVFTYLSQ